MTGATIQLVAKGVQDIFITKDPQITYFKIVYRRHTNFSLEAIPQYFTHQPDFGKKYSCTISQNGDLVGKTHLVVTLPKIKQYLMEDGNIDPLVKFAWVKKLGYVLIKSIEIEIGGQLIDRQYGEWLNIISELFIRKADNGIDKMIGNIEKLTSYSSTKDNYTLYIPLQFWFCRNPSLSLPILCLHHSDVKINIELNDFENCYILTPTHYIEVEDELVGDELVGDELVGDELVEDELVEDEPVEPVEPDDGKVEPVEPVEPVDVKVEPVDVKVEPTFLKKYVFNSKWWFTDSNYK